MGIPAKMLGSALYLVRLASGELEHFKRAPVDLCGVEASGISSPSVLACLLSSSRLGSHVGET